jgi:transcriptional regulator with XRE-family HTH domain
VCVHKLQNYLRTFRRRSGLSQQDISYLCGCQSGNKVSRYERFVREPSLRAAFIFEVVFKEHASDLFAGTFQEMHKSTIRRARFLLRRLERKAGSDPQFQQKLEVLREIAGLTRREPPCSSSQ